MQEKTSTNEAVFSLDTMKIGEELIQRQPFNPEEPHENQILKIVGNPERGFAAVLGQYRLTDWLPTPDDVRIWCDLNSPELCVRITSTMLEAYDMKQNEKL